MEKYKLIRNYPGGPELGSIHSFHPTTLKDNVPTIYWNHVWVNPKDFPEFWEKVVEKDYEILSFKQHSGIDDLWLYNKGWKRNGNLTQAYTTEEIIKNPLYYIYSVKRLSDGEIFTIGDKIKFSTDYDSFNIETIKVNNNGYIEFHGLINFCTLGISNIEKIKTPLFKTEDGVDIFENDFIWIVWLDKNNQPTHLNSNYPTKIINAEAFKRKDKITFSTKEAAENYILMNKPCLSLREVLDNYNKKGCYSIVEHDNDLIKLVKSKL